MTCKNVLIVEDEELMRTILRQLLSHAGYRVYTADSAEAAIEIFRSTDIQLTLTDIRMSGRDGLELLDSIKSLDPEALVVIMTAYSSVDTAVAALRKGAYDYVTKPFVNEDLLKTIQNAVEHRALFIENRFLRRELARHSTFPEIVGKSEPIERLLTLIRKVADTSANVLIQGETGTGKELVARAIHKASERNGQNFIAVNCGALPDSLLESELFGHVKGAFTGAITASPGIFRTVAGGTLFLDEIGEMSQALQVKLLRAIQEHEVTPVGSGVPESFDARIIAASNRSLETEVAEGRFREDLFYRLNVFEIIVPPLRERVDDIPLLANRFVANASRDNTGSTHSLSDAALAALTAYDWPGNVRELENVIERALILSDDQIDLKHLPERLTAGPPNHDDRLMSLDDVELRHIKRVMDRVGDDKVEAAAILGIDLSTLYRKLKRFESTNVDYRAESSSTK